MKLISYEFGQALQLIRMDEMRPHSGLYLPDVFQRIADRYRFIIRPTEFGTNMGTTGATFETGVICLEQRQIAVTSLGIYNDGLLVLCKRTEDADLVTDDFIRWVVTDLGLREPQTHIPRKYSSQVVVEFDASIDRLISKFRTIADVVESSLETAQGLKTSIRVQRLTLAADPADGTPLNQTTFAIEPRAGAPFSDNRYFCAAPLPSPTHLMALASIENALG